MRYREDREIGTNPQQTGWLAKSCCLLRGTKGCRNGQKGLSAISIDCPPRVIVTLSVTDSEGGRVGKHFVVCRRYAIPDTIAMREGEAVQAHSCEHAALRLYKPAVVFARGERTAAPRSLTPLLHAVLNLQLILAANLPTVSTILAANFPPVSTTPVANCHRYHQQHR